MATATMVDGNDVVNRGRSAWSGIIGERTAETGSTQLVKVVGVVANSVKNGKDRVA